MRKTEWPPQLQAAWIGAAMKNPRFTQFFLYAYYRVTPIERPHLGTITVDKEWRLYYAPEVIAKWDVCELTDAVYHEFMHFLYTYDDNQGSAIA